MKIPNSVRLCKKNNIIPVLFDLFEQFKDK